MRKTINVASRTHRGVTEMVRQRIEDGGERIWRMDDFRDLSFVAVAQALSRLSRAGLVQRLSRGVYYRPRPTRFGPSLPNPATLQQIASRRRPFFCAGTSAASLLGFTTQVARRGEVLTIGLSLPRKLLGEDTIIHTLRPAAWAGLSQKDGALLEFLRDRGRTSELSPEETVKRVLALLSEAGRFEALLKVMDSEPPRVRAMFGAVGQQLGQSKRALVHLRDSLNPLSRFDFGIMSALRHTREWQARRR